MILNAADDDTDKQPKVQQAAAAHNTSPRQHCDSLSNEFKVKSETSGKSSL
jgi:hypothetical protein